MSRAVVLLVLLAGCVPPPGEIMVPDGIVTYTCAGGEQLVVSYDTAADPPTAMIDRDGSETLLLDPNAPGLRYSWPSDGSYHIWDTDGRTGTLNYRDGERGVVDVVLAGCRA